MLGPFMIAVCFAHWVAHAEEAPMAPTTPGKGRRLVVKAQRLLAKALEEPALSAAEVVVDADGGVVTEDGEYAESLHAPEESSEEDGEDAEQFQGDIILKRMQKLALSPQTPSPVSSTTPRMLSDAVTEARLKWPKTDGKVRIPYHIQGNLNDLERQHLEKAIKEIASKTCVRWVPRENEADYVRVLRKNYCSSNIGMVGHNIINLGPRCSYGTFVHEMLHTIGIWHEHTRSDRDNFVKVNWSNIRNGAEDNFEKCVNCDTLGVPYDYDSVMHYHDKAFKIDASIPTIEVLKGDHEIGQRSRMTDLDAKSVNLLYDCELLAEDGCQVGLHWSKLVAGTEQPHGAEFCDGAGHWVRCDDGELVRLQSSICDPTHPVIPDAEKPSKFNGCDHPLCLPDDFDVDSHLYVEHTPGMLIAALPGMGNPWEGEAVFLMKILPGFEGHAHYHTSLFTAVMARGSQRVTSWGQIPVSASKEVTSYHPGDRFQAKSRQVILNEVVDSVGFTMLVWMTDKMEFIPVAVPEEKPCVIGKKHPEIARKTLKSGAEWCDKKGHWSKCVDGKVDRVDKNSCTPEHPEIPGVPNPSKFNGCGHPLCLPDDLDLDKVEWVDYEGVPGVQIALIDMGDPRKEEAVFLYKAGPGMKDVKHFHSGRYSAVVARGSVQLHDWGTRAGNAVTKSVKREGDRVLMDEGNILKLELVDDEGFVQLVWNTQKLEYIPVSED